MSPSGTNSQTVRSNERWIADLAARDDAALRELFEFLHRGLHAGLKGKIDEHLADDFAQETLIKVLAALDSYRGDCLFTTWAMSIGMRVAFTELRRARWKDVSFDSLAETKNLPDPADEHSNPGDVMILDQFVGVLRGLVETALSDRQRTVIQGELNGVPQAVLCDRLKINRNALYKLCHDARVKLKQAMISGGFCEVDVRSALAAASKR